MNQILNKNREYIENTNKILMSILSNSYNWNFKTRKQIETHRKYLKYSHEYNILVSQLMANKKFIEFENREIINYYYTIRYHKKLGYI